MPFNESTGLVVIMKIKLRPEEPVVQLTVNLWKCLLEMLKQYDVWSWHLATVVLEEIHVALNQFS